MVSSCSSGILKRIKTVSFTVTNNFLRDLLCLLLDSKWLVSMASTKSLEILEAFYFNMKVANKHTVCQTEHLQRTCNTRSIANVLLTLSLTSQDL